MRASIVGGLLATALLVVGCGTPMEELEDGADLSTQEAPLPDCASSPDYLTNYFRDGTYTNQIGARGCSCGMWVSWGTTSTYRQYNMECF